MVLLLYSKYDHLSKLTATHKQNVLDVQQVSKQPETCASHPLALTYPHSL